MPLRRSKKSKLPQAVSVAEVQTAALTRFHRFLDSTWAAVMGLAHSQASGVVPPASSTHSSHLAHGTLSWVAQALNSFSRVSSRDRYTPSSTPARLCSSRSAGDWDSSGCVNAAAMLETTEV